MVVDCSDCIKSNSEFGRKGYDCPVNDKYRQNHDECVFKVTIEQLEEKLKDSRKLYCPKHGWQKGWIKDRPIAGSSAPLFWFCPIKGCNVRKRGS